MNQVNCLKALRNLIIANEATLVAGTYFQGTYRAIQDVALSALDAPRGFYYYLIQVDTVSSQSLAQRSNVRNPHETCLYDCTIHVVDAAFMQADEYMPFEQMTMDFRQLTDRTVALLRGINCMTYPGTYNEFELYGGSPDRQVRVQNMDHTWEDAENQQVGAMLYSQMKFKLEERWA